MLSGLKSVGMMIPDTVAAPGPAPTTDPFYSYVHGLWHLDTDYTDSGPVGRTLLTTGTSATFGVQSTTFKYGTGSLRTSPGNTTSFVRIPANAALNVTGDFCFEFWIKATYNSGSYSNVFQTAASGANGTGTPPAAALGVANWTNAAGTGLGGTTLTCYLNSGSNQLRLTSTSNPNDNNWHHIALTRSGTTCRLFFDGAIQASGTYSLALDLGASYGMIVGRYTNTDSTNPLNGYLDDIRITLGVPRYTANFTPATGAFPNSG